MVFSSSSTRGAMRGPTPGQEEQSSPGDSRLQLLSARSPRKATVDAESHEAVQELVLAAGAAHGDRVPARDAGHGTGRADARRPVLACGDQAQTRGPPAAPAGR